MTVSSQTNNVTFVGNGVTTVFPLPFRFFANGDVFAYFIEPTTGASTPMALGTDYTLAGAAEPEVNGNAVSVLTTTAPLANGRGLYVERIMQEVQNTDIVNQGEFFASTHEDVFDRLTMLIQQANANSQGAIRVAIGDPEPNRLPPAPQRANFLMGFDSAGNPIPLAPSSGSATDLAIYLADNVDPTKGTAMVGRSCQIVKTIAELRLLLKSSPSKTAFATGGVSQGDGGGGHYYMDASDIVSADNGRTIIVAADGGRWKQVPAINGHLVKLSGNMPAVGLTASIAMSGFTASEIISAALKVTTSDGHTLLSSTGNPVYEYAFRITGSSLVIATGPGASAIAGRPYNITLILS